jgi:hypothetical protein
MLAPVGLYLFVLDGEDELDGVEVGSYADFGGFRDAIWQHLEGGRLGSRFPVLMMHSDCDGEWSPSEAAQLLTELDVIAGELAGLPAVPLNDWKRSVARTRGLEPANLAECFFDVQGDPLVARLADLCRCSVERGLPILFQ